MRQPLGPSWLKMLFAVLWQDFPGRQSPVIETWPLVEAMYSGRLCGKWTAVKFEATPHSPASFVNSLAGAPLPRTLAYDWFSNAITITCVHFGVTVVRPHGEAAAPAVAPPREVGTSTAST